MANPAFSNSPAFAAGAKAVDYSKPISAEELDAMYGRPSATPVDTDRMSYEDTIVKTLIAFGLLVATAAVGWFVPLLMIPGAIAGFVLALVNIFKKQPSRGLILAYAAAQGLFVGGISAMFNSMWDGIVTQAVFGTLAVIGVTLFLFLNGKVRTSPRMTKIFLVAMVGYAVFSLVNLGLMLFGVTDGMFGARSIEIIPGVPLGAILGVLIVLLAAYSLVMDFENVKTGVERGAPRIFGWQAAFGIMVTVVWLYVEILRLIAIFRE
ncbi:Bax inhibitor-1/YccA family protein [Salinibacterium sp. dk2585]|uniref:Bax inhibitor-1/YccA family protein n=1 Tax=unclassified Salinibacterium TaxID=2632331 RepID=UPI0011C2438F|nr:MULTISPECIES: Bax inhibitor-1/YccA family protein [unclassified Salinibacterium]QEE62283.1 Bax inhibitor-1/YccA family protein [Salinibacterium sp. dk2585]TXK53634.1 Bax inhibitor-1/YccA family protein [Salinibacterium sp. dk5596]